MKKKIVNNKKGFTLVEVLATVVILGIISGIGITLYLNTINKSKEKSRQLAVSNIKDAAELYSKEQDNNWKNNYNADAIIVNQYTCATVIELINKGYFNKDFFENEAYGNINNNTYIQIIRDIDNKSNFEVKIMDNSIDTIEKCEANAIINDGGIKINGFDSYTDRLLIDFNSDENTEYKCYLGDTLKSDAVNNSSKRCTFIGLENMTGYEVTICNSNDTVCKKLNPSTKDLQNINIKIDEPENWKQNKEVTITYDDTNIYQRKGKHLFALTEEIESANITIGDVYQCENENKCDIKVSSIEKDKLYNVNSQNVKFNVKANIDDISSDNIFAKILDQSNNKKEDQDTLKKIDTIKPTASIDNNNPATITCTDNFKVSSYALTTNKTPQSNNFETITSTDKFTTTKTISDSGLYYLTCKDQAGNTNNPVSKQYYKLTYNQNGGSGCTDSIVKAEDQSWGDLCLPTKTGYTFAGWKNGTTEVTKDSKATSDITITAQWNPNTYTVKYGKNGGKGTMEDSQATYNADFITRQNIFTRTGYTFNGWNESADGTGTKWNLNSKGVYESGNSWKWTYTKDITLYAQWEKLSTFPFTAYLCRVQLTNIHQQASVTASKENAQQEFAYQTELKITGEKDDFYIVTKPDGKNFTTKWRNYWGELIPVIYVKKSCTRKTKGEECPPAECADH